MSDKKEQTVKKENFFIKLWNKLTKEEWELTVLFPGESKFLPDGTRVTSGAPKTYRLKKLQKLTNKHIIFIDTEGRRHEINVVEPVGYSLIKVH